jgi:hypothetical protein
MIRRGASIGIGIGADTVRTLAWDGNRVTAVAEERFSSVADLAVAVSNAIDAVRDPLLSTRVAAGISLGPAWVQVRALPPCIGRRNLRELATHLRDNATRYFLAAGRPPVLSRPAVQADCIWAAAYDADVIDVLTGVCLIRRFRLLAIVPTIVALRLATTQSHLCWIDASLEVDVTFEPNGELQSIARRVQPSVDFLPDATAVGSLAALGENAWRFADAFVAAKAAFAPPTLSLTSDSLSGSASQGRARVAAAGVALSAAVLMAAITPGLAARRMSSSTERELASLGASHTRAMQQYRALDTVSRLISTVATIADARRSMTLAMAALTRAIPDSLFITDLRLDDRGGSLVAIGPHAAAVVAELAAAPGLDAPALVGPVTPQIVDGRQLERATVRFSWAVRAP